MTRGDKGKLFILFVPLFTLSLLRKIVCSLWSDEESRSARKRMWKITFGVFIVFSVLRKALKRPYNK